jgi:hypothetical protein
MAAHDLGRGRCAEVLGGAEPILDPGGPYRPAFAVWATVPENPFFARAMVNRTWAQFFGRGLVSPIDDVRPENESPHADLLRKVANQFVVSGFDLKFLARAICGSRAYQRTDGRGSDSAGRVGSAGTTPEGAAVEMAATLFRGESKVRGRPQLR